MQTKIEASVKLGICHEIYRKHSISAAEELMKAVGKFLADPDNRNTADIRFAFEDMMRNKEVADAMALHKG